MSAVVTPPSPPTSGTSLTVVTGEGALFPAAPFNATVCPPGVLPSAANAEIVRVTARNGDVLTITRAQEGSVARAVVVGDLCVASVTAKALQDIETTPYARTDAANTFTADQTITTNVKIAGNLAVGGAALGTSNVARTDAANTFLADQIVQNASVALTNTTDPVDARLFYFYSLGMRLRFYAAADNYTTQTYPLSLERSGDVLIYKDLYEKQRTTPMGHWKPYPYNAGNFTTNTGTWTVDAADVMDLSYMLIGKTLFLQFSLQQTSVTGSPNQLRIVLPESMSAPSLSGGVQFSYSNDSGTTWFSGTAWGSSTWLILNRDLSGTAWPTTTNVTNLRGTTILQLL
jgi:hypothetical protein